jgi:hypothetical protein
VPAVAVGREEDRSSKLKAQSSKLKRSSNNQVPSSNPHVQQSALELGVWNLELLLSFEL